LVETPTTAGKQPRMKKYFLPICLGIAGMLVAHFLLFLLGKIMKLNFMPYVITYPVTYIFLAFILTKNYPDWWLLNVICILIIPFIYWYLLLWSDGELHWINAVRIGQSSGMILILPFTFLLAMLVSLSLFKRKQVI
jgi:hypothetical protein